MLYENASIHELPDLAADEQVALEQKCDGVRVLAEVNAAGNGSCSVKFYGAHGEPVRFAAAAQWFSKLSAALYWPDPDFAIMLDGELMIEDGTFVVFDLPYLRFGEVTLSVPGETEFSERRRMLSEILGGFPGGGMVRLVTQAVSPAEKVALVEQVTANGGEGFMAKRLDSPYEPGRRVQHSVKCKFVYTADVIVHSFERTSTTGSARLRVWDGDELRDVGGCSLIGKPQVKVGDVIEVAYANFRGAMNQPRMLRVREDKRAEDCTIGQFPVYSKEVV